MNNITLNILDIQSVLSNYTLVKSGDTYEPIETKLLQNNVLLEQIELEGITPGELVENIQNEKVEIFIDSEDNEETSDSYLGNYLPDLVLGDLGEEFILKVLENEISINNNIVEVERISKTRPKYCPGYDIEVRLQNKSLIGIEVKSTRVNNGNRIHITNNELRSIIRMKNNYYLVILNYKLKSNEIMTIYVLKNPINTLDIQPNEIENITNSISLNNIMFYPQQFIVIIPHEILHKNKLEVFDRILT